MFPGVAKRPANDEEKPAYFAWGYHLKGYGGVG